MPVFAPSLRRHEGRLKKLTKQTMTKSITLNYAVAVLAAFAMVFAYAGIADAAFNSRSITITTTNRGSITNDTSARSHTGNNLALGSIGGDGDDGGDVEGDNGSFNNGGAAAGNGGNGGDSGNGGWVETGDAAAEAGTENGLNTTDVDMDITV